MRFLFKKSKTTKHEGSDLLVVKGENDTRCVASQFCTVTTHLERISSRNSDMVNKRKYNYFNNKIER
jgi:hypothetical protein